LHLFIKFYVIFELINPDEFNICGRLSAKQYVILFIAHESFEYDLELFKRYLYLDIVTSIKSIDFLFKIVTGLLKIICLRFTKQNFNVEHILYLEYKIAKLIMCQMQLHNSESKYKAECKTTQKLDKCKSRIRCHGGVSILC
jgi:hypothetical protein